MNYPICQRCNFTQARINELLDLLELSERDHAIADVMQTRVIVPGIANIIEEFYVYLQGHREYKEYFHPGEQLIRMSQSQENYLRTLAVNFQSPDYFEDRLRIGVIHSQIGLPPRLYECAYAKLHNLIVENIPEDMESETVYKIRNFLNKIITLDIALALESYHQINTGNLEASIDKLVKTKEILQERSSKDTLTGAANRAAILGHINELLGKFNSDGKVFSIVMCDVEEMREVNAQLGHMAGDLVLKKIVSLIQLGLRETDKIGRYGGDEFLIVLQNKDEDSAVKMMATISTMLAEEKMAIRGTTISHRISFGVTSVTEGDDLPRLLMRVDNALSDSKKAKH